MKTSIPYSLLLAAASCGLAFGAGETAYTTPVGYETLSLTTGSNYVGVRLQNPTVVAGLVGTITSTTLTDPNNNFGTLLTGGSGTTYIVQFENASGIIQEVTGASASGSNLTLPQDVTAFVSSGDKYSIRAASTIASVFGATNSAGLAPGFGGPTGADLIQLPNGSGGFDEYFYDGDDELWVKVNSGPVTASSIPIVYTDGFVMVLNGALPLTVSGSVLTKAASQMITSGTNYLGSMFPVGATLTSAYGAPATLATITPGFGGPTGADLIQIPNGSGGFNEYFYDGDDETWVLNNVGSVDGATVFLTPGYVFLHQGSSFNLLNSPPANYSTL